MSAAVGEGFSERIEDGGVSNAGKLRNGRGGAA